MYVRTLGTSIVAPSPLPARPYPLPAEQALIRDYKFPEAVAMKNSGQPIPVGPLPGSPPGSYDGETRMFLAAADAGFVPFTAEGFETMLAWFSVSKAERLAAGLDAFQAFTEEFLLPWVTRQDPNYIPTEYRIPNPATGGYHDGRVVTVVQSGPHPTKAGWLIFELSDGQKWEWAGPGYTPPAAVTPTKQEVVFVVSPPLPGGGDVRDVLAVQYATQYSDGTVTARKWERYAAQLTPAQLLAAFPGLGWLVTVLTWQDVPSSVQAEIRADLAPTGWGPDANGFLVQTGSDGNVAIPSTPGGVTIVPPPGSTDPITVFPPSGGVQTIPTPTSTPNAPPVIPPQSWWDTVVTPATGSPSPGAPATVPTPPGTVVQGDGTVWQGAVGSNKALAVAAVALVGFLLMRRRR